MFTLIAYGGGQFRRRSLRAEQIPASHAKQTTVPLVELANNHDSRRLPVVPCIASSRLRAHKNPCLGS
jgi:hypothetical protein